MELRFNSMVYILNYFCFLYRYTLSTWKLYCTGADGLSCYSDTNWLDQVTSGDFVQSFSVSTSVQFLKVPASEPSSQSK